MPVPSASSISTRIKQIDGVEVVSLVGRELGKTKEVADKYGIGHVTTDLAESSGAQGGRRGDPVHAHADARRADGGLPEGGQARAGGDSVGCMNLSHAYGAPPPPRAGTGAAVAGARTSAARCSTPRRCMDAVPTKHWSARCWRRTGRVSRWPARAACRGCAVCGRHEARSTAAPTRSGARPRRPCAACAPAHRPGPPAPPGPQGADRGVGGRARGDGPRGHDRRDRSLGRSPPRPCAARTRCTPSRRSRPSTRCGRAIRRTGILRACRELGTAFEAFSPLARAYLTGALTDPSALPGNDMRRHMPRFNAENCPAQPRPAAGLHRRRRAPRDHPRGAGARVGTARRRARATR